MTKVKTIQYSGFHFPSHISWSMDISKTCVRAKKLLGMLHSHFHQADSKSLSRLCKSIVLPVSGYGGRVWDPYHNSYVNKLDRTQEFAGKIMYIP